MSRFNNQNSNSKKSELISSPPLRSAPLMGNIKAQNKINSEHFLHRNLGNQAIQRAIKSNTFQSIDFSRVKSKPDNPLRTTISNPGDKHEKEADSLADRTLNTNGIQENTKQTQNNRSNSNSSTGILLPSSIHNVIRSSGKPLDNKHQQYFSSRFGVGLNHVRIHTGDQANHAANSLVAKAFSVDNNIVFGKNKYRPDSSDGKHLLAHELAHVVSPGHRGIMRAVSADYPAIQTALSINLDPNAGPLDLEISPAEVQSVLTILNALNNADFNDTVAQMRTDGLVRPLLSRLSNNEIIAFLQRVQRTGAVAFAAGHGMATQADIAQTQSTFMHTANTATATAAHGAAPTTAQVAAQQQSQTAATSIAPQANVLSGADETTFNTAATTAVATFVTWAQATHPQLAITAANFRVDSRAVFNRGQNVIAFGEPGKAVVGKAFADAVAANPAYAAAVVVHELFGHPQYGTYGVAGTEFNLEIYDQAAALMPGYTQPTGVDRRSEIDSFAYQETEIYSLMISVPFFTPVTAAHAALSSVNFDPTPAISSRIGLIKTQFEINVAQSLLRGMWMRFRLDTRLELRGLAAFEAGVRANFTAAQATAILQ